MSLLQVVIKGDIEQALKAAKARQVELFNIKMSKGGNCTIANVLETYRQQIIQWHGETSSSDCHHDRGYPIGSLLHHN
jgi:hypothetical protein